MSARYAIILLLGGLLSGSAQAHQMRSVLVTVEEQASGQVTLNMKSSLNADGRAAAVTVTLEPDCAVPENSAGSVMAERLDDAVLRRWTVHCDGGLQHRSLHIQGLDAMTPDAFVDVKFADGSQARYGLSRFDPVIRLDVAETRGVDGLWPYLGIGVEHILLGADHLLFVLGLLLLLQLSKAGWQRIVGTITAFTLAHSLTLAMAVLGGWRLPPTPVEIVIALSIVLLAVEICQHPQRVAQGLPPTLTVRRPWLVAFGFGLLHGFGFAGALAEIGVPEAAAGWALLLFNLGVEIGQLAFVLAVTLLLSLLRQISASPRWMATTRGVLVHGIGGLAVFWVLQRSLPMLPV